MQPALIKPGTEGDLPGIADVLNFTIMNSNVTLVASGRRWAGRWPAACGPRSR